MNKFRYSLSVLALVSFLTTMGTAGVVYGDDRLSFDVAQNGTTFVIIGPTTPTIPPFALQGAAFSVQGFVYPEGTLQGGAVSGTNMDGTPAFPDEVVGTWSCRGWFLRDDDPSETGAVIVSC